MLAINKGLIRVCLGIFILLFQQACGPTSNMSLLAENPCEIPCWQMIVPGETTRAEALQILTNSKFVDPDTIEELGSSSLGSIQWQSPLLRNYEKGFLLIQEGVVQYISLGTTEVPDVGSLIELFGVPEALTKNNITLPEFPFNWTLRLFYPSNGFIVDFSLGPGNTTLLPETNLSDWQLIPVMSLEGRIQVEHEYAILDFPDGYFMPWVGYGDVMELYPICLFC